MALLVPAAAPLQDSVTVALAATLFALRLKLVGALGTL